MEVLYLFLTKLLKGSEKLPKLVGTPFVLYIPPGQKYKDRSGLVLMSEGALHLRPEWYTLPFAVVLYTRCQPQALGVIES